MRAVCWHGKGDVRVESVPEPSVLRPHDAIVRVTSTAICGSDLHLYDGYILGMRQGDILGHECMGEVVEVGPQVESLRPGDRVVVPSVIACGECWFCRQGRWALCDNTNPAATATGRLYGASGAGLYGYSHLFGGYAGGQAEYVRVPQADHGPIKVPESLSDEQVLFLSDALPTGWMAAAATEVGEGDVVAVWGAGPVGLFAMLSARLMGAAKVFAIDRFPARLRMAAEYIGAEPIDYTEVDVVETLHAATGGRGPDACIDAVGMEAHGDSFLGMYDKAKQTMRLESDRPVALREAIQACRKGGVVSIPGVYGGVVDKFPIGAVFNKGLTLRAGQTHVQQYMPELLALIERGDIDPSFVVTDRISLDDAPLGYRRFRDKADEVVKVVMTP